MTIVADGNVGVGTTAPQAKLHVAGDARIDGGITIAQATRFLNVGANACSYNSHLGIFVPIEGRSRLSRHDSYNVSVTSSAPAWLPEGATVTGFNAQIRDIDAGADLVVQLRRESSLSDSGGSVTMAEVSSSGDGGFDTYDDTSIASPVIDNQAYAYDVRVLFPSASGSPVLVFYGARIEYTVISPLP
jgi:hypothetical protein